MEKAGDIQAMFGVNVTQHPKLFRVYRFGHVAKTAWHEQICKAHFARTRHNWRALGISA